MAAVYVEQSNDGHQFARAFASPDGFLAAHKDYLDEAPELVEAYREAAKEVATQRGPVEIESGTTLTKLEIEDVNCRSTFPSEGKEVQ